MADLCGHTGKIIRVNLTDKTTTIIENDWRWYRTYMGGRNIALYYLLKEVPKNVNPYSSENKLVIATSFLTGTKIPGTSRFTVATKSPLNDGLGEAEAGGWWGPELKFAGFDGIIIEGVSTEPVYLWIHDGEVEFRGGGSIWGKDTGEVQNRIREELGDKKIRVLQCGPAGEQLVRYANIMNECRHFCGRTGMGAVMGSKKLRAIAVRGNGRVLVKDENLIKEYAKWFAQNMNDHPIIKGSIELGTARYILPLNEMGLLPTKNFQGGSFEGAAGISSERMHEDLVEKRETCYACPIRCKRAVKGEKPNNRFDIDSNYGAPEYESMASLGSNCMVDDVEAVCKANELCAKYGLDTISTGVTIAFAMECAEKGLIPEEMLGGFDLEFGSGEALVRLTEMIARREGIGNVLADGSYRAGLAFGNNAEQYSMSTKKQELPAHEARGKWGVALMYAVSPTGGDHLNAAHDYWFEGEGHPEKRLQNMEIIDVNDLGCITPVPAAAFTEEKIRLLSYLQHLWSMYNVLDICIFMGVPEYRMMTLKQLVELVEAVTGWTTSVFELTKAGERGVNMARAFIIRQGLTDSDDNLPKRLFEPLTTGAFKGTAVNKEAFEKAKKQYYATMGWDVKGVPYPGKFLELGIPWVNEMLGAVI